MIPRLLGRRERGRTPVPRLAPAGDAAQAAAKALDRALGWGLVALLAWAPLPFGSARPWAWSLLGVLAAALLFVAGLRSLRLGAAPPIGQLRWPALLGGLLVAWVLVQATPGGIFGWHHPLWDKVTEALSDGLTPSISVDRAASLVYLFRLLTYAAVFLVAWQVGQRVEGARLVLRSLAAIGVAYALYGLYEFASPNPHILWFRKWVYDDDLTATFVNHNSFATYAGLCIVASLVLFAQRLMSNLDTRSRTTLLLSTVENVLWRGRWRTTACVILAASLLLTHSRGGALATVCGVAAFVVLAMTAPALRSDWRKPFGWLAGVGGLVMLALAGAGVLQRAMDSSLEIDDRGDIYLATLSAIHDNLLTGTGLGTFRFIFPMYQQPSLDGYVDMAHNDYLQNLLELGVPGALLLFSVLALLALECYRGVWRRRKDALFPCAAVAATVLVAVHSCVDFSLQIPAVSVTYAAILGIGVAQSVSSTNRRDEGSTKERRRFDPSRLIIWRR